MNLDSITTFFQWCVIIGFTIYIWTAVMVIFAKNLMFEIHSKWFGLSRENVNIALYAYLGIFKILLILFVLTPYLALLVMG